MGAIGEKDVSAKIGDEEAKARKTASAKTRCAGSAPGEAESLAAWKLLLRRSWGVSMSEVLMRFVEPLAHLANGEEGYRQLLAAGVFAWNVALAPDTQKQEEMIDDLCCDATSGESEELPVTGRELVSQLVARKESYFAAYRRPISDFVLTAVGDKYHLVVISAVNLD